MTARELQVGKSIEVEMGKKTKKVTDEADQDWRGECFEWWGKWPKLGIACLHGTRDRRTRTSEDTSMLERERETGASGKTASKADRLDVHLYQSLVCSLYLSH